jgi:type II secretion system protein G
VSKKRLVLVSVFVSVCFIGIVALFLGYYWGRNDRKAQITEAIDSIESKLRDKLKKGEFQPPKVSREEALATTIQQIKNIESALEMYQADCGSYPSEEQGLTALLVAPNNNSLSDIWKGPYLIGPKVPKDSWGSEFNYRLIKNKDATQNGTPLVTSCGPDGLNGTADDIFRQ